MGRGFLGVVRAADELDADAVAACFSVFERLGEVFWVSAKLKVSKIDTGMQMRREGCYLPPEVGLESAVDEGLFDERRCRFGG